MNALNCSSVFMYDEPNGLATSPPYVDTNTKTGDVIMPESN